MNTTGWIAAHREQYFKDGEAGHWWDSAALGRLGESPTILLITRGRKTGKESIMPLLNGEVRAGFVIIASRGVYPDTLVGITTWWRNEK